MSVKFKDNRAEVYRKVDQNLENFIEEVKDSLSSQASRNTKRVTGQLSDSYTTDSKTEIHKDKAIAIVGSSAKHSIYYELGTGEYALHGNGRKGGWVYRDKITGKFYFTKGQTPKRPLYRAYIQKREKIARRAKEVFGDGVFK